MSTWHAAEAKTDRAPSKATAGGLSQFHILFSRQRRDRPSRALQNCKGNGPAPGGSLRVLVRADCPGERSIRASLSPAIRMWRHWPRARFRFLLNRQLQNLVFEQIGAHHAVDRFECGKESLDRYLRESARRDRSSGIAAVWVLASGTEVIGYYTLHQHVIEAPEMPAKLRRRLSHYPAYPATLIGRSPSTDATPGRATAETSCSTVLGGLSRLLRQWLRSP